MNAIVNNVTYLNSACNSKSDLAEQILNDIEKDKQKMERETFKNSIMGQLGINKNGLVIEEEEPLDTEFDHQ